jgi:hypothetical protein
MVCDEENGSQAGQAVRPLLGGAYLCELAHKVCTFLYLLAGGEYELEDRTVPCVANSEAAASRWPAGCAGCAAKFCLSHKAFSVRLSG